MTDPKLLKQLADMCRKVGIKHYKCADFEFTLSEQEPQPKRRQKKTTTKSSVSVDSGFETDSLTDEELLMWSATAGGVPFSVNEAEGT